MKRFGILKDFESFLAQVTGTLGLQNDQ